MACGRTSSRGARGVLADLVRRAPVAVRGRVRLRRARAATGTVRHLARAFEVHGDDVARHQANRCIASLGPAALPKPRPGSTPGVEPLLSPVGYFPGVYNIFDEHATQTATRVVRFETR